MQMYRAVPQTKRENCRVVWASNRTVLHGCCL